MLLPIMNCYIIVGDTEILLDVVEDPLGNLFEKVKAELDFSGFKGAQKEELPRLQNLQAKLSSGVIPIYRYPGNTLIKIWI
mmetsp:Transcript_37854/g.61934  ORF Transcript_37854/g.61934 Transcript_37854/m.61934 type:complete len:81 (+) Transcript_37854:25-267(+)